MRHIFVGVVSAFLFIAATTVPGLQQHKTWAETPEAYFMTAAEREEWSKIRTDQEAEAFISAFRARRGSGFAEEVAERAANADKYLTVAKLAGSKTLRGKLVILLGPPAAFDVSSRPQRKERSGTAAGYLEAAGESSGVAVGDVVAAKDRELMTGSSLEEHTFTFSAAALPAPHNKKDLVVTVEVNSANGKDRIPSRKAAKQLEAVFEAAARASIAPAPAQ